MCKFGNITLHYKCNLIQEVIVSITSLTSNKKTDLIQDGD